MRAPALHVRRETPQRTRARLLDVIAAATLRTYDEPYVFEEVPLDGPPPRLDRRALAVVRDDRVWSFLVPAPPRTDRERFGLIRFHFPEGVDTSGFVGWLAAHLKRNLGTGVFVLCGYNGARGGVFDYTGFPFHLREAVLREVEALRRAGAAIAAADSVR